jgi:hypothetical protein
MKPGQWQKILLPAWPPTEWTWRRAALLAIAVFSLIDSFFVPMSRDVDPGRASEGILFLILGFRAVSRSELPVSILIAGGCLSALVAGLNHSLIRSPSLMWTPVVIILLLYVLLGGRRKGGESGSEEAGQDSRR